MRDFFGGKGLAAAVVGVAVVVCGLLIFNGVGAAGDKSAKKVEHQKAYAVFTQKCLGCHVSVADPEKPGKTRDEWHLVVNVMHDYGLGLTAEESELIVDLLYDLRQGIEKEAG
jgi:hypothetical protein